MTTATAETPTVPPPPIVAATFTSVFFVLAFTSTLRPAFTVPPSFALVLDWNTSAFAPPATPTVPPAPKVSASSQTSFLVRAATATSRVAFMVALFASAATSCANTSGTIVAPTPAVPPIARAPAQSYRPAWSTAFTVTSPRVLSLPVVPAVMAELFTMALITFSATSVLTTPVTDTLPEAEPDTEIMMIFSLPVAPT